jgi:hypothetical protein
VWAEPVALLANCYRELEMFTGDRKVGAPLGNRKQTQSKDDHVLIIHFVIIKFYVLNKPQDFLIVKLCEQQR